MIYQPKQLDEKGRCCGRKPWKYKRPRSAFQVGPHSFCGRCMRAFEIDGINQIENWAWKLNKDGTFTPILEGFDFLVNEMGKRIIRKPELLSVSDWIFMQRKRR